MLGLSLVIVAIEAVTSLMGETIRGKLCATSRGEQLAMKQEPFFWGVNADAPVDGLEWAVVFLKNVPLIHR